jgi:hypothetical protein
MGFLHYSWFSSLSEPDVRNGRFSRSVCADAVGLLFSGATLGPFLCILFCARSLCSATLFGGVSGASTPVAPSSAGVLLSHLSFYSNVNIRAIKGQPLSMSSSAPYKPNKLLSFVSYQAFTDAVRRITRAFGLSLVGTLQSTLKESYLDRLNQVTLYL